MNSDRLDPERDTIAFWDAVEAGLKNARRQLHRGRPCRQPADCELCADLVSTVHGDVFAIYRTRGVDGWSSAYVKAAARNAYADRVRSRMARVGLVAKPERWLTQTSFLPEQKPAERALVVATVLSVWVLLGTAHERGPYSR